MRRALFVVAACLAAACAAAENHPAPRGPAPDALPAALLARGRSLLARGDHGRAAAYLEAALDAGGDERIILPPLVASLVRSCELRRALPPLSRMREIWPDDPALPRLERTITSLLGEADAARPAEARR
jgi:hypothetical protein